MGRNQNLVNIAVTVSIAVVGIAFLSGCDKEGDFKSAQKEVQDVRYADWTTFVAGNVKIIYAPMMRMDSTLVHLRSDHFPPVARIDSPNVELKPTDTLTIGYKLPSDSLKYVLAELTPGNILSTRTLTEMGAPIQDLETLTVYFRTTRRPKAELAEMGQAYAYLQRKLQEVLGFPAITDTITVYYYTGYGQGRELTTQEYPFADSSAIHFWLPSFYGPPMMQYLLPRWAPDPPKNKFLKHGLISLFDLSGQKYHESTIGYINGKTFIPLDSLARDTSTNSNLERYQSGEAASFCAFVIGQYGPQALKDLYVCPQPFDVCVRQTLMTSVDTLQSLWLGFVRMNVPKDSLRN